MLNPRSPVGATHLHLSRRGGFTLVELVVVVALLAILAVLAAPSFTEMVRNSQVRSVTDALQTGLRTAKAEAVRRNRQVVFTLTNDQPGLNSAAAANGVNWAIHTVPRASESTDEREFVQGGAFASTSQGVTITGPTALCFNSMGRLVVNAAPGVDGASCTLTVDLPAYTVEMPGSNRPLQVNVSLGGQVRMCDPSRTLSADNPDGCPAP